MKLTDIDLHGLGQFNEEHASFTCNRYHLPVPWEYQLHNGLALLRLRQDGGSFFQIAPPGGSLLLNQERLPTAPAMLVWIIPEKNFGFGISDLGFGGGGAFTNFWLPTLPLLKPGTEPKAYSCAYSPQAARYHVEHDALAVDTEIFLPPDEVTMVMSLRVTNTGKAKRKVTLMPVAKPHLAAVALAPWDVPSWYQTSAFTRLPGLDGFWLEMRDPAGNPARRLRAAFVSDLQPTTYEPAMNRFIGDGRWDSPQAVWEGKLAKPVTTATPPYGQVTAENAAIGQPPLAALARQIELDPGQSFDFTVVLGKLPETTEGQLPPQAQLTKLARFFDPAARGQALGILCNRFEKIFAARKLQTPDEALNRYINEFVALQLVQVQDRGWTNMRGVRDTSQDATGLVPVDPSVARKRLFEVLGTQRSDGWFLRQYSTLGRFGQHDSRPYVDAGVWVFEMVWEYLVYTRDFAVLSQRAGWLDKDGDDTLLTHVIHLFDYYLAPANIGEHGLCKIREGDWNDSVNAAGLEGRGETVMVTAQAVYTLNLAADLLHTLAAENHDKKLEQHAARFERGAAEFKANMLKHALNAEGYFNAVFNDAGRWIFSPQDPDGQHRINSTPNTFAIIAGVVSGPARDKVFTIMDQLKGPYGWRLFHPAIGQTPMEKLGRMGHGDLAPGMGENGTPYNHGSHGFLARAAWTAGRGDLLYATMRYMLPYDQQAHPIQTTKTTPYAIVNHYQEVLGMEGQGGWPYSTGSVAVAVRNAFDGFLGFRPNLHYLVIDPVIPATWATSGGEMPFLGGRYRIHIKNPNHVQAGVKELLLDGQPAGKRYHDVKLGREVVGIPIQTLKPGKDHEITVTLGA